MSAGILMSTSTIDIQKGGFDVYSRRNKESKSTKMSITPIDFDPQILSG